MTPTQIQNAGGPLDIDLSFEDHGTIILVRPLTASGQAWTDEHLGGAMQFQGAICCERRYADAIVDGAVNDGLTVSL